jgi:hypothetical protein
LFVSCYNDPVLLVEDLQQETITRHNAVSAENSVEQCAVNRTKYHNLHEQLQTEYPFLEAVTAVLQLCPSIKKVNKAVIQSLCCLSLINDNNKIHMFHT